MTNTLNLREGDYFRTDSQEQFDAVLKMLESHGIVFDPQRRAYTPEYKSSSGLETLAIRMDSPVEYGRLFSEDSIQHYGGRLITPKYERKMIATFVPRENIVVDGKLYDKEELLLAIKDLHSEAV